MSITLQTLPVYSRIVRPEVEDGVRVDVNHVRIGDIHSAFLLLVQVRNHRFTPTFHMMARPSETQRRFRDREEED
jgi:hypothetical protein